MMSKQTTGQSNVNQNKSLFIVAVILFATVLTFFFVYQYFAPQPTEGAKAITIQVLDNTQTLTEYQTNTDAEYLLDAMKDTPEFSFSGYESQYGLTLTTINGITADWDKDNAFWCIYVNGEMGNYGVETQPVADGDVFLFEYAGLNGNA